MSDKKWLILLVIAMFVFASTSLVMTNNNQVVVSDIINTTDSSRVAADGDAWLTGWQYRREITMIEIGSAGTNYQIKIDVNYNTGAGATNTINCTSNCQTDFGDVRFTDGDGNTELDYWIEESTASDDATFWVEVADSLSLGESVVIYVYYGTSGTSTTTSNGTATFILFDDFNDASFDTAKWYDWGTVGTITESGGVLTLTSTNTGNDWTGVCSKVTGQDMSFETSVKVDAEENLELFGFDDRANDGFTGDGSDAAQFMYYAGTTTKRYETRNSGAQVTARTSTLTSYTRVSVSWDSSTSVRFFEVGVLKASHTTQLPAGEDMGGLFGIRAWDLAGKMYSDWVFMRKYFVSGPYFVPSGVASEEDTKPVNDVLPVCTNPSDGDNLYPKYTTYTFTSSHQDSEGYDTIEYVELSLSISGTPYWTAKYTEATDTYSETVGSDYIALLEGSEVKSGINLDITWNIEIEWAHTEKWNHELYIKVEDESGFYAAEETVGLDYEIICGLFITTPDDWITADADGGTIDRGDVNGDFTVSANAHYDDGQIASSLHPPNGAVTWWVYEVTIGTYSSDTTGADGAFSVTATADNAVGLDTYTLRAVPYGEAATWGNLFTTTETDDYISDRIKVISYSGDDARIDVSTASDCSVLLRYEYDNLQVGDGSVTVNGVSTVYGGAGEWDFGETKGTTQLVTYDTVIATGNTHGVTAVNNNGQTYDQIWDRVDLTMTSNYAWTIIDNNVTLSATGVFEYDSGSWSGVITWADRYPSESTVNSYNYGASQITSVTDPTYGLTAFFVGTEMSVVFDDVAISGGDPNYYWVQYSPEAVWLIWGSPCSFEWDYNDSAVIDGMIIQARMNDTENARASTDGGSIYGLSIGSFDTSWYYVNITIYSEFTVDTRSFNITIWAMISEVDILHSLQIVNFNIVPTDYHFWITFQTNLLNASITVWDDAIDSGTLFSDNIYNSLFEGMHQISRSTTVAAHNITICITSTGTEYDRVYSAGDYVWWYNFTYIVTVPPAYDCHIVILNNLFELIQFDTFEVYVNNTRIYHDIIQVVTGYDYNITIKNRFDDTVNSTIFAADFEMVIFVNTFSFKFMNWYNGFLRVNVTRSGVTYSEIIMPTEIIEFNLYAATYTFTVDFLNGTTKFSQEIVVSNSTGYVITGDSLTDVFDLVNTVYAMTNAINITVTTTSNNVVTISLDLSNVNTTIYTQTVSILTNIANTNSTVYDQTVSLIAQLTNINSTLYAQTVSILSSLSSVNTTLYTQTVSILSNIENVNSTLYTQTITLIAAISNIDSDIAAQTITILADISNVNTTLYTQTVSILSNLVNVNSTIYNQIVTVLSNISNLNATMYLIDDPTHLNPLVLGRSLSDDYCDFTIVTNWHNSSISIYDNNVIRTGPTSELLSPIRYPLMSTAGTHNLSVFIDAGVDSFWYNISYTVAEIIAFELNDWYVRPNLGIENWIECYFGTTWGNSTVYVYDNGTLQTSVLEQDGGISFGFWMSGIAGLHQYEFNITSGSNIITITWDFYLPDWAETALVMRFDIWTYQNNYTLLELETNWMNCTFYVYLNDSLVATSYNDPVTLNITRSMNNGTYNLTIYADGGSQTYTIKNIRYIVTEEGVTYDYSSVTGGNTFIDTVISDPHYEGDTNYENPPGGYMSEGTIATIAVTGVLVFFLAYLFVDRLLKKKRLEVESEGN